MEGMQLLHKKTQGDIVEGSLKNLSSSYVGRLEMIINAWYNMKKEVYDCKMGMFFPKQCTWLHVHCNMLLLHLNHAALMGINQKQR